MSRRALTRFVKLRLPVSDEFLAYVLTGCIESPFGSHFMWSHVKRGPDGLIQRASLQHDTEAGAEGTYPERRRIRLIEVRHGIERILSKRMVNAEYTGSILFAVLENDTGHIDQVGFDAIIQAAVFGKVVFG